MLLIANGVHRLPESRMPIGHQFSVTCQRLHRLSLPNRRVIRNKIADLRFEHEKTPVDPTSVTGRFFLEASNLVSFTKPKRAEPRRRYSSGNGGFAAVRS